MSKTITVFVHQPNKMKEEPESCRMCLKISGDFISLDSSFEESSDNFNYWDVFNFCTHLSAQESDGLPKIVCLDCTNDLQFVFQVLKKAEHSEQILKRILEKQLLEEQKDYEELVEEQVLNELIDETAIQKDYENIEYNPIEEYIYVEEESKLSDNEETNIKEEFACIICNSVFINETDLMQHIVVHHNEKSIELDPQLETSDEATEISEPLNAAPEDNTEKNVRKTSESNFMCEFCAKTFTSKQKLKMHTFVHTKEKNFACTLCPKRFTTIFKLREHLRNHANIRNHECSVCKQKFFSKHTLVCHMRRHTGERPYKCEICDKSFSQSSILKTHFALHQGKTTQCPHCPKMFSRPSHLILHQRSHTGERPYSCNYCPNSYKQKSHLDRHIDTHMGVKFACSICQKEYTKKGSLKNHMYSHSDVKPYKCKLCLKDFPSNDRYRRHMRNTHKTEAEFDSAAFSDESMN